MKTYLIASMSLVAALTASAYAEEIVFDIDPWGNTEELRGDSKKIELFDVKWKKVPVKQKFVRAGICGGDDDCHDRLITLASVEAIQVTVAYDKPGRSCDTDSACELPSVEFNFPVSSFPAKTVKHIKKLSKKWFVNTIKNEARRYKLVKKLFNMSITDYRRPKQVIDMNKSSFCHGGDGHCFEDHIVYKTVNGRFKKVTVNIK